MILKNRKPNPNYKNSHKQIKKFSWFPTKMKEGIYQKGNFKIIWLENYIEFLDFNYKKQKWESHGKATEGDMMLEKLENTKLEDQELFEKDNAAHCGQFPPPRMLMPAQKES